MAPDLSETAIVISHPIGGNRSQILNSQYSQALFWPDTKVKRDQKAAVLTWEAVL